jgi:hypothetical protein
MHVLIGWEAVGTARAALRACLDGHSWVRVLPDQYVVRVASAEAAEALCEAMKAVCRENPGGARFIMTPPMSGGAYAGWLPQSKWPMIRRRTEP